MRNTQTITNIQELYGLKPKAKRLKYWSRDYIIKEVNDLTRSVDARQLAKRSGVSTKTIHKLRLPVSKGGTRFAVDLTLRKVLRSVGLDLYIGPLKR